MLEAAQVVAAKLRSHPYSTCQALQLHAAVLHTVFSYSAPLAKWSFADLDQLENWWTLALRRAWKLTDGHHTVPFLLPPERGGLCLHSPARLMAKHSVLMVHRLTITLDRDVTKLMWHEWISITGELRTQDVRAIQTLLALEDDSTQGTTLLR